MQQLAPLGSYFTRSRGLTALSFALNVRQGGMNAWGFHFVNVVIHVANALLVYVLVLSTLRLPVLIAELGGPDAHAVAVSRIKWPRTERRSS